MVTVFTHTHDVIILKAVKLHRTGFVTGTDAGTDKSIKFFIKFLYIYFIDGEIHVLGIGVCCGNSIRKLKYFGIFVFPFRKFVGKIRQWQ